MGIASALIGAGASFGSAFMQNQWAQQSADVNYDWLKMMSDTAHRREMRDLKLAGLNPILTATGGQGASSGGAQAAPVVGPDLGGGAVNGAMLGKLRSEANANKEQVRESQERQKLIAEQARSASSAADVAGIEAARQRLRADIVDKTLGDQVGVYEELPQPLRGAARVQAVIGKALNDGKSLRAQKKWNIETNAKLERIARERKKAADKRARAEKMYRSKGPVRMSTPFGKPDRGLIIPGFRRRLE